MRLSDTVLLVHCTTFSLHCRCNPRGAAYFSRHTADLTFLILQTLYSKQTPSPPAADVVILILYILLSHSTKFFSYCRCDPPGFAHFLYSYSRCDFFDSADFLLTQDTLSFCYKSKQWHPAALTKSTNRRQMVKVITYVIPDYKIKLKIRLFQVMDKKYKEN